MDYKEILKGIVDIINTTEKSDIGFANICTPISVKTALNLKSEEDEDMLQALNACIDAAIKSGMNYISFDSKSILIGKVKNWIKSIKERMLC